MEIIIMEWFFLHHSRFDDWRMIDDWMNLDLGRMMNMIL